MTSNRPSQFTLLEFAAAFAKPETWVEYQAVYRSELSYDDPQASAAYHRRRELEREFVTTLIDPEHPGHWIIEARGEEELTFTRIDPRVLKKAKIDFVRNESSMCWASGWLTCVSPRHRQENHWADHPATSEPKELCVRP